MHPSLVQLFEHGGAIRIFLQSAGPSADQIAHNVMILVHYGGKCGPRKGR